MNIVKHMQTAEQFQEAKALIQNRFGKNVELMHLFTVSPELRGGSKFEQLSAVLRVPFRVQDQIVAMAQVTDAADLSESECDEIAEILVNQMQASWEEQSSERTPLHFLIQGGFAARNQRVAEMIHEHLDNWAHLRWSSLMNSVESMLDLKSLGSVTISFDHFEKISVQQWEELATLVQDPDFEATMLFFDLPLIDLNLCQVPVMSLPVYDYDLHQTLELLLDKTTFLKTK